MLVIALVGLRQRKIARTSRTTCCSLPEKTGQDHSIAQAIASQSLESWKSHLGKFFEPEDPGRALAGRREPPPARGVKRTMGTLITGF